VHHKHKYNNNKLSHEISKMRQVNWWSSCG
jgi:hypothetical protein